MSAIIMVVDDEELTRQLIGHFLTRAGYTVLEAANGREALKHLATVLPDLIIMDVLMPDIDGFTTIRQIRADPQTTHIPIIFLSSRADVLAEHEGLLAGAQRYLTKPLGLMNIVQEVQNLLGKT